MGVSTQSTWGEREGRDRQEENGAATRGHSGFMHATHRHVWPVAYWCSRASCANPSNPPSQPTKKKVQFALSTHAVCLCLRFSLFFFLHFFFSCCGTRALHVLWRRFLCMEE